MEAIYFFLSFVHSIRRMKLLSMYIHKYTSHKSLRRSVPSAKLIITNESSLLSDQHIQASSQDEAFRTYISLLSTSRVFWMLVCS